MLRSTACPTLELRKVVIRREGCRRNASANKGTARNAMYGRLSSHQGWRERVRHPTGGETAGVRAVSQSRRAGFGLLVLAGKYWPLDGGASGFTDVRVVTGSL